MNLTLFIETSTSIFNISLVVKDKIQFNSIEFEDLQKERNIAAILNKGLQKINQQINDIDLIVVNAGPGGTNSVRSGISFANSLGYSLKIPVSFYNAFEAVGLAASIKYNLPIVCTAKAINGNIYLGLFENGELKKTRFGKLTDIFNDITVNLNEFAVAGMHRHLLDAYSNDFIIHDSGLQMGHPENLLTMKEKLLERKTIFPHFVKPITENSVIFKV